MATKKSKKTNKTIDGVDEVLAAVDSVFAPKTPTGKLRKLTNKREYIQATDDPRSNLKKLVSLHKGWTRKSVAVKAMAKGRVDLETGELIESNLPDDIKVDMTKVGNALKLQAGRLTRDMEKELKQIPLYTEFLSKVFGCGPIVSAYIISEIDIHRAVKSSAIRKYCGFAVINGKLDRRQKGVKLGYNAEMRTRIFQMFSSMAKQRRGGSTKYLEVWDNAKHREIQRLTIAGAKVKADGKIEGQGKAHSKGWHKAADVFLEDLYIIWRAMEGLPVWPSYYAAKLGYEHGGKISVNAPKMLTVEEALDTVGFVGRVGGTGSDVVVEEDEELDQAAE